MLMREYHKNACGYHLLSRVPHKEAYVCRVKELRKMISTKLSVIGFHQHVQFLAILVMGLFQGLPYFREGSVLRLHQEIFCGFCIDICVIKPSYNSHYQKSFLKVNCNEKTSCFHMKGLLNG